MVKLICLFVVFLVLTADMYSQPTDVQTIEFKKADSISQLYPHHSLKDLTGLSRKLTSGLTTESGKFRAIYKWVCLNIDGDFTLSQQNKRKREKLGGAELDEWNKEFNPRVFKLLVDQHRTVCTGYAYLISELSLRAGLYVKTIHGYGRTSQSNIGGRGIANHSWNAIRLDGKWYLCDATWSAGALDLDKAVYVRNFREAYFLSDPTYFIRNHYPLDPEWTLLKQSPTLEEFLNGPLVYVDAYKYQVLPVSPGTFEQNISRGAAVSFNFASRDHTSTGDVELIVDGRSAEAITLEPNGVTSLSHVFKSRGTHIVHVTIDDDYIVSYKVKVK